MNNAGLNPTGTISLRKSELVLVARAQCHKKVSTQASLLSYYLKCWQLFFYTIAMPNQVVYCQKGRGKVAVTNKYIAGSA